MPPLLLPPLLPDMESAGTGTGTGTVLRAGLPDWVSEALAPHRAQSAAAVAADSAPPEEPERQLADEIESLYQQVLENLRSEEQADELSRMIEEAKAQLEKLPKDPGELRSRYWRDYVRRVSGADPDVPGNKARKTGFILHEILVNLGRPAGRRTWEEIEQRAMEDFRYIYAPQRQQSVSLLNNLLRLKQQDTEARTRAANQLISTLEKARSAENLIRFKIEQAKSQEEREQWRRKAAELGLMLRSLGLQLGAAKSLSPKTELMRTVDAQGQSIVTPVVIQPSPEKVQEIRAIGERIQSLTEEIQTRLRDEGTPVEPGKNRPGIDTPVSPGEQLEAKAQLSREIEKYRAAFPAVRVALDAAREQNVPEALVMLVMLKSDLGQRTVGDDGSIGPMSLDRRKLEEIAKLPGMENIDPTDPAQNIRAGVAYLKTLYDRHEGDINRVIEDYFGVFTHGEPAERDARRVRVLKRLGNQPDLPVPKAEQKQIQKEIQADLSRPPDSHTEKALAEMELEARRKGASSPLEPVYRSGFDTKTVASFLEEQARQIPLEPLNQANARYLTRTGRGGSIVLPGFATQEAADRARLLEGQDFLWTGLASMVQNLYVTRDLDRYVGNLASLLYTVRTYSPFDTPEEVLRQKGLARSGVNLLSSLLRSFGGYSRQRVADMLAKPRINETILRSMLTNLFQYTIYPRTGKQLNQIEIRQVGQLMPNINQSPENFLRSVYAMAVLYRLLAWAEASGQQAGARALNALRNSRGVVNMAVEIAERLKKNADRVRRANPLDKPKYMEQLRSSLAIAMNTPMMVSAVLSGREDEYLRMVETGGSPDAGTR